MNVSAAFAAAGALALMIPGCALAHHSTDALFDRSKTVEFTGILETFDMINPHVWFHFYEVLGDSQIKEWSIESGAPTQIRRSIIEQFGSLEFEVGKKYTVKIAPARANEADGYLKALTFPDGSVFTCC
jgi:hypothetical protein